MSDKQELVSVELKAKDIALIDNILNGTDWLKAAKLAGYSAPHRDAQHIFTDQRALAYAYRKTRGRIQLEGAPVAYKLMFDIMTDTTKDLRFRIDVAKILFAAGGFTPPKAGDAPEPPEDTNKQDMSIEDMKKLGDSIAREIAKRKQPTIIDVTPEPINQPIENMF
jgi:hypothetical protein